MVAKNLGLETIIAWTEPSVEKVDKKGHFFISGIKGRER